MKVHAYEPADLVEGGMVHGRHRLIEESGRTALHLRGIRDRFILPEHTVNQVRGTVTMWVLPLDDLFPAAQYEQHLASNLFARNFTFLSDREAVGDVAPAQFCIYYESGWHPVFMVKFHSGDWAPLVWTEDPAAIAMSGHFEFERLHWYQLAVVWDRDASHYRMYANGVLVAHPNSTASGPLRNESCGPFLYGGNPALAYSTIEFHDEVLTEQQLKDKYTSESSGDNSDLDAHLQSVYQGTGLTSLEFQPDESWQHALSVPFKSDSDLLAFHHQGAINDMHVEPGVGLHISTPPLSQSLQKTDFRSVAIDRDWTDWTRMYLWSRRAFEGDLYLKLEFKTLARGGLALLCAQAAGMQGESFLDDYYLRTDGSMRMVCWEDVRNYHWEFYREMADVRNDLVSHACLKNPWYKPMSFQVEDRRWELDRWYTLEYLQEGPRLRGLIDGVVVMDVVDHGMDNNGPVLLNGHIGLRCMMRTKMVFRNLEVFDRPHVRELSSGMIS